MIGNRDYSVLVTVVPFGLFCVMIGLFKLCIRYDCLQYCRKTDDCLEDDNLVEDDKININAEDATDSVIIIVQN
jgi:hypothetical protein